MWHQADCNHQVASGHSSCSSLSSRRFNSSHPSLLKLKRCQILSAHSSLCQMQTFDQADHLKSYDETASSLSNPSGSAQAFLSALPHLLQVPAKSHVSFCSPFQVDPSRFKSRCADSMDATVDAVAGVGATVDVAVAWPRLILVAENCIRAVNQCSQPGTSSQHVLCQ